MTASVEPVVRGGSTDREFNPHKISPSRVNKYLGCGEAFRRYYIDKEEPGIIGSAALFGTVVHGALEKWSLNRNQDLVTLMGQAWLDVTAGTAVAGFIGQYQALSIEAMKKEKEIRDAWADRGKVSKAPRMTKDWKESKVAKDIGKLLGSWHVRLNTDSPWRFTESDPLPSLYDESLILGKKYAAKWRHLPSSLHTEFGFNVEWEGFLLNGFIDCIDPVLTDDGELTGYEVVDYKTYKAEPPGAKDWRQGVIYDVAFEALCRSGALPFDPELPFWVVFDYPRLLLRRDYSFGPEDREVLLRDLRMYRDGVSAGVFLPAAKNQNPDFCDYGSTGTCCIQTRGTGTGCRGGRYREEEESEA